MAKTLLSIFLLLSVFELYSQGSDFLIVKKKNGRTERLFTVGGQITYNTLEKRYVSGTIERLSNDSIVVRNFVLQRSVDFLGLLHYDTITSYLVANNYKEIGSIRLFDRSHRRKNYWVRKVQSILFVAGAGYTILNLANGAYFDEKIGGKKNLTRIAVSVGAIGTGLLIGAVSHPAREFSTPRKYRIVYVDNTRL